MKENVHSNTSVEKAEDSKKPYAKAMDLNALRVFVTVAELAGFSAAGKKLGMPKWSASRSVSALEAAMGVPLLHRTTRRVSLSPAGAALLERIEPLISSLDLASREWQEELGQPAGKVRIVISSFLQTAPIGAAITKFMALHSAVDVDIHFADLVNRAPSEGFDLEIQINQAQIKDSSLVARRGWPIDGQLFASPAYLAKQGMPSTMDDLEHHECILYSDLSSLPIESPNEQTTFKSSGRIHSNDVFFVRETIRSGAGIGLLPVFLAENDVAAGRLVSVLPSYHIKGSYVYVIRPFTREVPLRVKALSDFLFEYMKANPLTTSTG